VIPGRVSSAMISTMRFRSRTAFLTRFLFVCGFVIFLAAGLSACAEGAHSERFVDPALAGSYISLEHKEGLMGNAIGAAIVVSPNIAVTNSHNANLILEGDILARSSDYDLLFFRTALTRPVTIAEPRMGQQVVAYGNGGGNERREARGFIVALAAIPHNCPNCPAGTGFAYRAPGGPGFSGGPVVEAESGAVLGLTFAYIDGALESGEPRRMLAYTMAQIRAEMARLLPR